MNDAKETTTKMGSYALVITMQLSNEGILYQNILQEITSTYHDPENIRYSFAGDVGYWLLSLTMPVHVIRNSISFSVLFFVCIKVSTFDGMKNCNANVKIILQYKQ